MENRSHALVTGLFTIALLGAAVLLGIWFNRDNVKRVPYLLATTLSVPGLNPQAEVRYRGLEVGRVDTIDFDPRVAGQILVHISVDEHTPVTKTTFATLGYQGVTGIAYVQLDDDSVGAARLATNAGQPARIMLRPGLLDQLEKRGVAILDQVEQVSAKINALASPANQKIMLSAFQDLSHTAQQFDAIPKQLGPTLAELPKLTAQAQHSLDAITNLSGDVSALARNWNLLGTRLQAPGGAIDKVSNTMDQLDLSVQAIASGIELEALPHVIELSNEASSSMRALKSTMHTLNEHPQSLLFGAPAVAPGPGETNFVVPTGAAAP